MNVENWWRPLGNGHQQQSSFSVGGSSTSRLVQALYPQMLGGRGAPLCVVVWVGISVVVWVGIGVVVWVGISVVV